ncbi:NADPH-dependent F420 reductase [Nocardia sp. NPDC020380]|uniref:NADPH-dependent F420 reductase n=1 Tax=Nocardia sp. NPDC020380 TaxID=3364309 RepID=UPI0037A7D444
MRIGIIGAGAMARALGTGWAAAGHEVVVGGRDSGKAAQAAVEIGNGARGVSLEQAAGFGEVVLLALPVSALGEVLAELGPEVFAGRTLIDCTNAFLPQESGWILSEDAVAERISATVPGAHVVKAFNLLAAEVWAAPRREVGGARLTVPLCGDDPTAVALVAGLAEDLELRPVRAGGLNRARYLEATSVFVVGLWFGGHDSRAMFPPLEAVFAGSDSE